MATYHGHVAAILRHDCGSIAGVSQRGDTYPLTLRTGQGPTGSQASSLLGCFFHPCCLAPEGGAPASWTLTPSPGELGSRKQPGSSGAHLVQGCVTALTPGNDVPGNAAKQE